MKRLIILFIPAFILCACSTTYSPRNYKQYQGIDYNQYERETTQYTLPEYEEISEENLQTDEVKEVENIGADVQEITEEEIIESSNQAYGDAVVVMANKKISLGKNAISSDLDIFQKSLDAAYSSVLKSYRTQGFTYAMSPAGTVNPLSVMDVQCILSENFANANGKKVCDFFFAQIPLEYAKEKEKQAQ